MLETNIVPAWRACNRIYPCWERLRITIEQPMQWIVFNHGTEGCRRPCPHTHTHSHSLPNQLTVEAPRWVASWASSPKVTDLGHQFGTFFHSSLLFQHLAPVAKILSQSRMKWLWFVLLRFLQLSRTTESNSDTVKSIYWRQLSAIQRHTCASELSSTRSLHEQWLILQQTTLPIAPFLFLVDRSMVRR